MPSMLLHVDEARLPGLRLADLDVPGLERVRDGTLYLSTVRDDRVRVVGHIAGWQTGEVITCDVDITRLLDRFGCSTGPGGYAAWARAPRVLTPTDVDLLRYTLGLPLDMSAPAPLPPPAPTPTPPPSGYEDDPIAQRLLGAIHDDVHFDEFRLVLADHLQERGDPRGEFIALQIARAHTGEPPTDRERELALEHAPTWVKPLARYLTHYELRRGFLATAIVDDRAMLSADILASPTWATVEDLETRNLELLMHPQLGALRRVGVTGSELWRMAAADIDFPIEAVVGTTTPFVFAGAGAQWLQGGLVLPSEEGARWRGFESSSLARVRALSLLVDNELREAAVVRLMRTRLGRDLDHLELFANDPGAIDLDRWRRYYEAGKLRRLGLRGLAGDWVIVIVIERLAYGSRLVIQLGQAMSSSIDLRKRVFYRSPPRHAAWLPAIVVLGAGLRRAAIELVGDARLSEAQLDQVIADVERIFPDVELGTARRWRSP